jgi:hypothetical protein
VLILLTTVLLVKLIEIKLSQNVHVQVDKPISKDNVFLVSINVLNVPKLLLIVNHVLKEESMLQNVFVQKDNMTMVIMLNVMIVIQNVKLVKLLELVLNVMNTDLMKFLTVLVKLISMTVPQKEIVVNVTTLVKNVLINQKNVLPVLKEELIIHQLVLAHTDILKLI